jgi:hypothetical protein
MHKLLHEVCYKDTLHAEVLIFFNKHTAVLISLERKRHQPNKLQHAGDNLPSKVSEGVRLRERHRTSYEHLAYNDEHDAQHRTN